MDLEGPSEAALLMGPQHGSGQGGMASSGCSGCSGRAGQCGTRGGACAWRQSFGTQRVHVVTTVASKKAALAASRAWPRVTFRPRHCGNIRLRCAAQAVESEPTSISPIAPLHSSGLRFALAPRGWTSCSRAWPERYPVPAESTRFQSDESSTLIPGACSGMSRGRLSLIGRLCKRPDSVAM